MAKTELSTRNLFVPLTDEDHQEMSKTICENLITIDQKTAEKKAIAKEYKDEIDTLHAHNSNLAGWINQGGRDMDIAVEIRYNTPRQGVKTIIRQDTYESWEEDMVEREQTLDNMIDHDTTEEE